MENGCKLFPQLVALGLMMMSVACEEEPVALKRFDADPEPAGARLWLAAALSGSHAVLEVWGAELGPVFGYSLYLDYDAELLAAAEQPCQIEAAVLDPEGDEALYATNGYSGRLAIGGTRLSSELGEVEIGSPTRLVSCSIEAAQAGSAAVRLSRVIVRRANGAYVWPATAGGSLVAEGGL